jgi:hypothetical protein
MNNPSKKKQQGQTITALDQSSSLLDNNKFIYLLLGTAMLFVLIARMHLLSFPFERDEGEYAYMGSLILNGHPPYTLAYNMKFPGTYYMYAIIMGILGETVIGVHTGLIFVALLSMLFVFLIARNYVSKIGAVISASCFGIIGTSWTLLGQAAHATHFVIFFALLGTYIIHEIYNREKYKWFFFALSGLFFAFAFICKQSGLFFVLFGIIFIFIKESKPIDLRNFMKKLVPFLFGFLTHVILMFSYFYVFGNFNKFWFWTIEYLSKYSEQVPLSEAPQKFKMGLDSITAMYSSSGYIALWVLALLGIPLLFAHRMPKQSKTLLLAFFFTSFLTIVPGYNFRQHYFITLLPAIGLLNAIFFDTINQFITRKFKYSFVQYLSFFAFILLIGLGVKANADYLFETDPEILCKQIYGSNPFRESAEIAQFLEEHTSEKDKIAVLGSEPQLYFYAHRYAASGYIYTYNLVELHSYALAMQKEMIKEIETNHPKYLVDVHIEKSWMSKPNSEKHIFNWSKEYIKNHFKLVALTEIYPDQLTQLKQGEELNNYIVQSKEVIYIYERI